VADQNIRMTARDLRWLLDATGGNVAATVAGYYQGLASIHADGVLASTQIYVTDVLQLTSAFGRG
jgi:hypothetical protein